MYREVDYPRVWTVKGMKEERYCFTLAKSISADHHKPQGIHTFLHQLLHPFTMDTNLIFSDAVKDSLTWSPFPSLSPRGSWWWVCPRTWDGARARKWAQKTFLYLLVVANIHTLCCYKVFSDYSTVYVLPDFLMPIDVLQYLFIQIFKM